MVRRLLLFALIFTCTLVEAVQLSIGPDFAFYLNMGNLMLRFSDNAQVGVCFSDDRARYTKMGFLNIKNSDAQMLVSASLGKSWALLFEMNASTYGIFPGKYTFRTVLTPDNSHMLIKASQKVFLPKNTINFSTLDSIGRFSTGFSRVYANLEEKEIGMYRVENGVFVGFFPYSTGSIGEQAFFMGIGWMDDIGGLFAFRTQVSVSDLSVFLDPFVIVRSDGALFGIRADCTAPGLEATFFFSGRQVLFNVSF